jgi:hypothetical protein
MRRHSQEALQSEVQLTQLRKRSCTNYGALGARRHRMLILVSTMRFSTLAYLSICRSAHSPLLREPLMRACAHQMALRPKPRGYMSRSHHRRYVCAVESLLATSGIRTMDRHSMSRSPQWRNAACLFDLLAFVDGRPVPLWVTGRKLPERGRSPIVWNYVALRKLDDVVEWVAANGNTPPLMLFVLEGDHQRAPAKCVQRFVISGVQYSLLAADPTVYRSAATPRSPLQWEKVNVASSRFDELSYGL